MDDGFHVSLDGISFNNYKVVLGGLDRDFKEENSSLGEYESLTVMSLNGQFKLNHGGHYTNTLNRQLTFTVTDFNDNNGMTQDEYAEFQHKFINQSEYKKLCFTDHQTLKNYYYNAKLLNPSETIIESKVVQFTVEVECDSIFAYKNTPYEQTFSTSGTYTINNESHIENLYPNVEITCNTTGDIIISNNTNNTSFKVSLSANDKLIIDNMHQVTINDTVCTNIEDYIDFSNSMFLILSSGNNNITISGDAIIKISHPICKKVGW